MPKKVFENGPDLTVEYSFPTLNKLKGEEINITYEHYHPNIGDGGFIDFRILKVGGINTVYNFKYYITSLYKDDYGLFIKRLYNIKLELRIDAVDALIEDFQEFISNVTENFTYNNDIFKKFRKSGLEGTEYVLVKEDSEIQRKIFKYAEPYVLAFEEAISELNQKLISLKDELERDILRHEEPGPLSNGFLLSFTYIHYSKKTSSEGYKNLSELFNGLKNYNFIGDETDKDDFFRIFSGLEIFRKIRWIKDISSLHHFIKKLKKYGKFKDIGYKHYKIACNCFVDEDYNDYDPDNLSEQKSPKDTRLIDKLIALL